MSDVALLRSRSRDLLAALDLPDSLTVAQMAAHLAGRRGRPLLLDDMISSAGPSGMWVAGDRRDYVFCDPALSGVHRAHVLAHEFAHMIWQHGTPHHGKAALARLLAPGLRLGAVHAIYTRDSYTDAEERQAEVLASVLSEHLVLPRAAGSTGSTRRSHADEAEPDAAVAALTSALGARSGRRR